MIKWIDVVKYPPLLLSFDWPSLFASSHDLSLICGVLTSSLILTGSHSKQSWMEPLAQQGAVSRNWDWFLSSLETDRRQSDSFSLFFFVLFSLSIHRYRVIGILLERNFFCLERKATDTRAQLRNTVRTFLILLWLAPGLKRPLKIKENLSILSAVGANQTHSLMLFAAVCWSVLQDLYRRAKHRKPSHLPSTWALMHRL